MKKRDPPAVGARSWRPVDQLDAFLLQAVELTVEKRKNPGDDMLTLQEACRYLRVPEGTLRYWRHLGAGPRSFKVGRHVRYWRTDLILWLTEQTNRPQNHR